MPKRSERKVIPVNQTQMDILTEMKTGTTIFRAPGNGRLFFSNPNRKGPNGTMDWRWLTSEQEDAVNILVSKELLILETRSF